MVHRQLQTRVEPEFELPPGIEHPRGTLTIVAIFGALFALGWFAMYLLRFMSAGVPHH